MKRIATTLVIILVIICFCFVSCNNAPTENDGTNKIDFSSREENNGSTKNDPTTGNNSASESDYASKIDFPSTTGTYKYYSYGYHWSTVTVSSYDYDISEQSKTQIRIDFDFNCTFDYHGENAAGNSFDFYILVYDKDGNLIKDSIVNETDAQVGDTIITKHTILLDKDDVNNGIVIEFSGNK